MTRVQHSTIKVIDYFSIRSYILQHATEFRFNVVSTNNLNATVNPLLSIRETDRIAQFLSSCNCDHWKPETLHGPNISELWIDSTRIKVVTNESVKCSSGLLRIMLLASGLE